MKEKCCNNTKNAVQLRKEEMKKILIGIEPMPFGASCEQCFLVEAGAVTVIIGSGSLDQAHTVDEYVEKTQLLRAAELYRQIAMDILK